MYTFFLKCVAYLVANFYLRNPSYQKRIVNMYSEPIILITDILNHISYWLKLEKCFLPPTYITIETSNACNLKCKMCPQPAMMTRERKMFDLILFKKIIDANPQLKRVGLTNWGEPLLHKQLAEFIKYLKDRNIKVNLTTNATLLDEGVARNLVEMEVDFIAISMDGYGESYERTRGTDFNVVKANVERLVALNKEFGGKSHLEINCVNSKYNENELDDIYAKLIKLDVDNVNMQSWQVYDPECRKPGGKTGCSELYRTLTVLSNGVVVPCCVDYDGQLNLGSIHDSLQMMSFFNGPVMRLLRKTNLSSASAPPVCKGCWEYTTKYSGNRFT